MKHLILSLMTTMMLC